MTAARSRENVASRIYNESWNIIGRDGLAVY